MEDILNNVSNGWDSQLPKFCIKYVLGNVYDDHMKIKIFIEVFRKELPDTPARIEPMKLTLVEGSDWYINRKNKQAPRLQNIAKQYALRKFTFKAIANGQIKHSNAMLWSHSHLTIERISHMYGLETFEQRNSYEWLDFTKYKRHNT